MLNLVRQSRSSSRRVRRRRLRPRRRVVAGRRSARGRRPRAGRERDGGRRRGGRGRGPAEKWRTSGWPLRLKAWGLDGNKQPAFTLLAPEELVYLFLGSPHALRLIQGAWGSPPDLKKDRVYVRTAEGFFETGFRALTEPLRHLHDLNLFRANQSIVVTLRYSRRLDPSGRLLGVVVGQSSGGPVYEQITLTEDGYKQLRRHLLPPPRSMRA